MNLTGAAELGGYAIVGDGAAAAGVATLLHTDATRHAAQRSWLQYPD